MTENDIHKAINNFIQINKILPTRLIGSFEQLQLIGMMSSGGHDYRFVGGRLTLVVAPTLDSGSEEWYLEGDTK